MKQSWTDIKSKTFFVEDVVHEKLLHLPHA